MPLAFSISPFLKPNFYQRHTQLTSFAGEKRDRKGKNSRCDAILITTISNIVTTTDNIVTIITTNTKNNTITISTNIRNNTISSIDSTNNTNTITSCTNNTTPSSSKNKNHPRA